MFHWCLNIFVSLDIAGWVKKKQQIKEKEQKDFFTMAWFFSASLELKW